MGVIIIQEQWLDRPDILKQDLLLYEKAHIIL